MGIDNKYAEMLTQQVLKFESDLILQAMPANAVLTRCKMVEQGHNGPRIYSYENKPFLIIYPPKFETVFENGAYKLKAHTEYKIYD
jgi:hypothetical protein